MGKTNNSSEKVMELKKGPWTREEDQKLLAYIQEYGHGSWRTLPAKAGLERCGKSCRMRWTNYLRPDIKRGKFSTQEEKTIIRLHALLGNRWSAISAHLPKRTDNEIKNYWNTRLKKRLTRMGIDPVTHKPKNIPAGSESTNLNHMAQWETARLEAEARLVRKSKILRNIQLLRKTTCPPPPPPPPPKPTALPCLDVLKVWQATSGLQTGFFAPAGTLESPTSTLNFSSTTGCTITPIVHGCSSSLLTANDINYMAVKDRMENTDPVLESYPNCLDYDEINNMSCLMDFATVNGVGDLGEIVGDSDDDGNYWSELLRLVSYPNGPQMFQV